MSLYATAGAKLYIGGTKSQKNNDFTSADFTGETWVEIANLENLGSLGDTSETVSFNAIGESRTKTLKGPRSAGTMEVVCGISNDDAGQLAAIAAEKTPYDYGFRLVLNDAPPSGSDPTPSERMFIAKVMSASEAFDEANSVMKLNISLAVNSNVVRIAAAMGD
ncbi:hypothetical protein [Martelella limonii]|uniref:hypothetical protein n=1 Tax=Martelella limonii TaxID=1647649 RepID=UPI001580FB1C|nr:hypothetical protein [Martelella limonii]